MKMRNDLLGTKEKESRLRKKTIINKAQSPFKARRAPDKVNRQGRLCLKVFNRVERPILDLSSISLNKRLESFESWMGES